MFTKVTEYVEKVTKEKKLPLLDVIAYKGHEKIYSHCTSHSGKFGEGELLCMFSCTKVLTAVLGMRLVEEGKISLSDTVVSHFPERIDADTEIPPHLASLTIRQMLTMTTAGGPSRWWFSAGDPDRTHLYLNDSGHPRAAGTLWEYDSAGSQVLSSLVEKLAGMPLLDYLK